MIRNHWTTDDLNVCKYVCMYREGAGLYQPRRHRLPTGPHAVPKRFSVVAELYVEML